MAPGARCEGWLGGAGRKDSGLERLLDDRVRGGGNAVVSFLRPRDHDPGHEIPGHPSRAAEPCRHDGGRTVRCSTRAGLLRGGGVRCRGRTDARDRGTGERDPTRGRKERDQTELHTARRVVLDRVARRRLEPGTVGRECGSPAPRRAGRRRGVARSWRGSGGPLRVGFRAGAWRGRLFARGPGLGLLFATVGVWAADGAGAGRGGRGGDGCGRPLRVVRPQVREVDSQCAGRRIRRAEAGSGGADESGFRRRRGRTVPRATRHGAFRCGRRHGAARCRGHGPTGRSARRDAVRGKSQVHERAGGVVRRAGSRGRAAGVREAGARERGRRSRRLQSQRRESDGCRDPGR